MRALQVVAPMGVDGLAVRRVPSPLVAAEDVLVAVTAVSANQLDRAVMRCDGIARGTLLPRTLGIGPTGVVVAQGSAVVEDLRGKRVIAKPNVFCGKCSQCRSGAEADCTDQWVLGVHRDGGAAELVALPARALLAIPEGLSDELAAAAVHTVPVAKHMLDALGELYGSRVLVTGARGAVGSVAVQLAALKGAVVTGLDTVVGPAASAGRILTHTSELCEMDPFHAVLDTTGDGTTFGEAIGALGWRGRAVTCAAGTESRVSIDLAMLYQRRLRIIGSAAANLADVHDGLRLLAEGKITIPPPLILPLEAYREAYAPGPRDRKAVFRLDAR